MDLAALTRMSEAAATDHKNTRADELQRADLGYRSDELWAVTSERLVRCFPERDDWTEIALFEDVMIAAAVLLQQRVVARDSMALWASGQRSAQYHGLVAPELARLLGVQERRYTPPTSCSASWARSGTNRAASIVPRPVTRS